MKNKNIKERGNMGDRIQRARRKKGLSLKELSSRLSVSTDKIVEWESGSSVPDASELSAIAGACGISAGEILYDGNRWKYRLTVDYTDEFIRMIHSLRQMPQDEIVQRAICCAEEELAGSGGQMEADIYLTEQELEFYRLGRANFLFLNDVDFWEKFAPRDYESHTSTRIPLIMGHVLSHVGWQSCSHAGI